MKEEKEYFEEVLSYNLEYAQSVWDEGEDLVGLIVSSDGHLFPMIFRPELKGRFFQEVKRKFTELGITCAWMISEGWRVIGNADKSDEVAKFTSDGGSLEFWPGREEVLILEMCNGIDYEMRTYVMDRSTGKVVPKFCEKESTQFQPLATAGVKSNLTRLFE